MKVRGRHWVLLWLGLFLVVAGAVIARNSAALLISRDLAKLRDERATLEARRAELEGRIRAASSRQFLIERARRSGLRQPEDSEIILLGWPPKPDAESR